MRYVFCLFFTFCLMGLVFGQNSDVPTVKTETTNKVLNLELPPNQEVKPDEGFVLLKADCKGTVKWLVVSPNPVKYVANDQNNTLIVGVPPSGAVTVFAVGLCENKITEFAKTVITVQEPPKEAKETTKTQTQPLKW